MAGSLGMFWHLGRHLEGRQVLSRLVGSHDGSPAARALALQAVSIVERPRGCLVHPNPRCAEAAAESLALFEELGDTWHAALSRVLLAVEGVTGAHPDRSQALLAAAEEQFDRDGDPWGPAVIGFVRMETAIKTGDVDTAVRIGRTTAVAFRQLDDAWGLSATLYHLGWGLRQFGRFGEAAPALEEAIDVARGAGLWNTAQWALADLAIEKVHLGDHDAARQLFDEAAAASREIGDGAGEVLAGYGYGLLAHVPRDWDRSQASTTRSRWTRSSTSAHPSTKESCSLGWGGATKPTATLVCSLRRDTRRRWRWVAGSASRASPRLPSRGSHGWRSLRATGIPPPRDSSEAAGTPGTVPPAGTTARACRP